MFHVDMMIRILKSLRGILVNTPMEWDCLEIVLYAGDEEKEEHYLANASKFRTSAIPMTEHFSNLGPNFDIFAVSLVWRCGKILPLA
jgi:hypothetical protein